MKAFAIRLRRSNMAFTDASSHSLTRSLPLSVLLLDVAFFGPLVWSVAFRHGSRVTCFHCFRLRRLTWTLNSRFGRCRCSRHCSVPFSSASQILSPLGWHLQLGIGLGWATFTFGGSFCCCARAFFTLFRFGSPRPFASPFPLYGFSARPASMPACLLLLLAACCCALNQISETLFLKFTFPGCLALTRTHTPTPP